LSKEYLRREKNRMDIASEPVGWYAQRHIEMRTGRRVAQLDTSRHAIALNNGEEISFDRLLIATGAFPATIKVPGNELPNVFYLRTIDDCDRLHHAIDKARAEGRAQPEAGKRGRAVVVGGGLLAVEVAASLRQLGLHVEQVFARKHPWAKFAGESTGRVITKYLENHGAVIHAETAVERFEGDGRVQRVIVSNNRTIDCDFVVVAVGIIANRELLRGTPISAEKAILVNDHCSTNVEGIYAAGDCCAIFDPRFGKHCVLDHWESARLTGAIAGANMAGDERRYEDVNHFASEVFKLKLSAWGEARFVDRRLVRGTPNVDSPDFAEIGVASDGRIAQVLALGRTGEHTLLQQLVERRMNVEGLEDVLRDPTKDLATLPQ
jgi:NAD(P)H-nitrite reductase large subunit